MKFSNSRRLKIENYIANESHLFVSFLIIPFAERAEDFLEEALASAAASSIRPLATMSSIDSIKIK